MYIRIIYGIVVYRVYTLYIRNYTYTDYVLYFRPDQYSTKKNSSFSKKREKKMKNTAPHAL
jgi:hypothetical protein